jgi:hypothetical protein
MTVVLPKFKGWTKPETVTEVLERSLEHAKLESKWSHGSWFELDDLKLPEPQIGWSYDDDYDDSDERVENLDEIAERFEGLACTDVKACSAGIIAIETLDGEALYKYMRDEESTEQLLLADPLARRALEFLADAYVEVFGASPDDAYASPLHVVIHRNDSGFGDPEHHAKIVRGFERALEMSKEASAA